MNNSIFVIKPFKWNGMWVFDDERVGLDKEPFVAGADTMIDTAVQLKGIQDAEDGLLMVFSAGPFPDADFDLEWVREDSGGNVYKWGRVFGITRVPDARRTTQGARIMDGTVTYPGQPTLFDL